MKQSSLINLKKKKASSPKTETQNTYSKLSDIKKPFEL